MKSANEPPKEFEPLHSTHREADHKIPMHAVFAGAASDDSTCVVADNSDIYMSLLQVSIQVNAKLYFRQGKAKDKQDKYTMDPGKSNLSQE